MKVAGLDVSKAQLDCSVQGVEGAKRFGNNPKSFKKLVLWLNQNEVTLVVLESTGGYERSVYTFLWASGIKTALVNPRQTRAFAYSLGRRAKSDLLDAEILMQYGVKIQPSPSEPLSEHVRVLRELLGRRYQLNKMLIAEKNHGKAPNVSAATRSSIHRLIKTLKEEIKALDRRIEEVIRSDAALFEKSEKLRAETGVGPVLLSTLLADMPELGKLERNQVSALAGVAPYDRDSGMHKGKRSIAGGRVRVRNALYMATLAAIRHNEVIRAFYQRLLANGKPRKVAIVACMRKFIIHLNAVLKENPEQHFLVAGA